MFCFCFFRAFAPIFTSNCFFCPRAQGTLATPLFRRNLRVSQMPNLVSLRDHILKAKVRFFLVIGLLGAVHKRRWNQIAKNWPILPPCPQWLNPLPPCPCGQTINFKKSKFFCTKKCERPHLKKPPPPLSALDKLPPSLTADVFCGCFLWTAHNEILRLLKSYDL